MQLFYLLTHLELDSLVAFNDTLQESHELLFLPLHPNLEHDRHAPLALFYSRSLPVLLLDETCRVSPLQCRCLLLILLSNCASPSTISSAPLQENLVLGLLLAGFNATLASVGMVRLILVLGR